MDVQTVFKHSVSRLRKYFEYKSLSTSNISLAMEKDINYSNNVEYIKYIKYISFAKHFASLEMLQLRTQNMPKRSH